jgi:HSP20 family protein
MAIVRWAPFSAFTSVERDLQDMLERFTLRPFAEGFTWRPAADVFRTDGTLVVRAELPGIDPEAELSIDVESNVLHIKGEKKLEREVDEESRYLRECRYGSFHRDVMLPEGVDAEAITATYDQGVLTVEVPLPVESAEEAGRVTVKVTTKETQPT